MIPQICIKQNFLDNGKNCAVPPIVAPIDGVIYSTLLCSFERKRRKCIWLGGDGLLALLRVGLSIINECWMVVNFEGEDRY